MWSKVSGYLAIATGVIACPCHLPVTMGILLAVLSGTGLGAFLSANPDLLYAGASVYFVGALFGGFYLINRRQGAPAGASEEAVAADCCAPIRTPPDVARRDTVGASPAGAPATHTAAARSARDPWLPKEARDGAA